MLTIKSTKPDEVHSMAKEARDLLGFKNTNFSEPYQLNFIISFFCVSGCKTCNIWKIGGEAKKGELSLIEIEQVARNSPNLRWIRFTGGEPFMRKDLEGIVRAFHENSRDLRVANITTNSFNVDHIFESTLRLAEIGIDRLFIGLSLDGDRDLHHFIRGVDSFNNVMRLFKKLSAIERVEVFFSYTVSKYNVGRFQETFQAVKSTLPEVTEADFNFNLYGTSPVYYHNAAGAETKEAQALSKEFVALSSLQFRRPTGFVQEVVRDYVDLVPQFLLTGKSPITCSAIKSTVMLDPYGSVYPCITWDKRLGNVRQFRYSIPAILSQNGIESIRKTVVESKCPGCWTPCEAFPSIIDRMVEQDISDA